MNICLDKNGTPTCESGAVVSQCPACAIAAGDCIAGVVKVMNGPFANQAAANKVILSLCKECVLAAIQYDRDQGRPDSTEELRELGVHI